MAEKRVEVWVATDKYESFYFNACYKDYKDLINKAKEECKNRYKRGRLLNIFFEDDTYLQSCTDGGWAYIDNGFPEKRIIKRVQ